MSCKVEGCEKSVVNRMKLCPMHSARLRRHGDVNGSAKKLTVEERFWAKVDKTDDCWLWLGRDRKDGYGSIKVNKKDVPVHRWAYERFIGKIPAGLVIDHLCRVRNCVNPRHLEPVTPRTNLLRGETIAVRNVVKTHCSNGHLFDFSNTYTAYQGWRKCRTCAAIRERSRRSKERV